MTPNAPWPALKKLMVHLASTSGIVSEKYSITRLRLKNYVPHSKCCQIIMGRESHSYRHNLLQLGLETLSQRRAAQMRVFAID